VTDQIQAICEMSDFGHTPAQIAAATGVPAGRVYAVLRAQRPDRVRAPRRLTSLLPARVLALHGAGLRAKRIAELCGCSKAYIYRILKEAGK
jgi:DNA-directed RNA polymerase specialized sigma24 family protein